ncbi:MAG: RelA/SpoT domain-containing protein [Brevundimonas sp.]|uniref:RelA/SpoT domain-containing protein n=1 Tax=Brevundimonas sp. TaxID=1871086 RepID=UPI001A2B3DEA|nr:RelA/SpoT domain-containing protein [Brevundimonas sp.]MBJ7447020.1 RelA/SpoT domain-containing protein [Brevundimonas sp.]
MTEAAIELYNDYKHDFRIFMDGVVGYIGAHPKLVGKGGAVHSTRHRLKDADSLRHKIARKAAEGRTVDETNIFDEITDLAGVRVLHLFQHSFAEIDAVIRSRVQSGDWCLGEKPRAYTWDPEAAAFFSNFDVDVRHKPTSYTSVHYLLKPRADSLVCCEVQVRTLFEEIWGEVDHQMNYPDPTDSLACREQILVLSKLVGAGSRLLDALHRVKSEI